MPRFLHDDQVYSRRMYTGNYRNEKRYGFFSFVFDAILTMITGGFWLLWVFVREMRRR